MSEKIRVSVVSYANSIPFVYGLQHTALIQEIDLSTDNPAECANKLISNKVDIGLVPVAIIPSLPYSEIVSDYCIGATGKVKSVVLASNCKIEDVTTIYLDVESRSSVALAQILAVRFWKINATFKPLSPDFEPKQLLPHEAVVLIGDKTFFVETKFKNIYDLGEEWYRFTKLPFVFAAWVANKKLPSVFIRSFNDALAFGVSHIADGVAESHFSSSEFDVLGYLQTNIEYHLNGDKYKAMEMFLKMLPK